MEFGTWEFQYKDTFDLIVFNVILSHLLHLSQNALGNPKTADCRIKRIEGLWTSFSLSNPMRKRPTLYLTFVIDIYRTGLPVATTAVLAVQSCLVLYLSHFPPASANLLLFFIFRIVTDIQHINTYFMVYNSWSFPLSIYQQL